MPAPGVLRGRVRAPAAIGLRRGRLVGPLVGRGGPRLIVVVAPPGSGKSTLLSHVAEAAGLPVAWLTVDAATVGVSAVLAHLRAAFAGVPGLASEWPSPEAALSDLDAALVEPVLLVLDDVHWLEGEPATDVLRMFVRYQPELLRIALGSRTVPDVDLPRWRLTGTAVEIDADVLRFRTWEVEELFRHHHGVRLRADEVAALTRRTGGWAAGLQLFHLATARRPPSQRAALLAGTGSGGRLTRAYLARHVLDRVSPQLQEFLVRSSVLDELTAARCDTLLERADADDRLSELDRIGLFSTVDASADGTDWAYRYHEVLRAHLLEELAARHGADAARELHRRAGGLLAAEGAYAEAIRSYCRAEDWVEAGRILSVGGASLAEDPGAWIDALPAAIRDQDPWALLALARRLVADGVLDRAAASYQQAVDRFAANGGNAAAAGELRLLQAWIAPPLGLITDWVHVARAALADPKEQLRTVSPASAGHQLALGVAHLVSGDLPAATEAFGRAAHARGLPALAEAAALLGRALSLSLSADPAAATARDDAAAAAKHLGAPVLARLADGLQAAARAWADPAAAGTIDHLRSECDHAGDRWGAALLRLFAGLAGLSTTQEGLVGPLEEAERQFGELAAPALAAWAATAAALATARSGRPYPAQRLAEVQRLARGAGPLPYALALLAVAAGGDDPVQAQRVRSHAARLAERCGVGLPAIRFAAQPGHAGTPGGSAADPAAGPAAAGSAAGDAAAGAGEAEPAADPGDTGAPPGTPAVPRLRVRCLGGFRLDRDGSPVDLDGLRPQNRALLRLLCLHAGRTVHRDRLLEWFWSGRDPERSQHSLQVAISELRRLIEPDAARGDWTLLRRDGNGYRIALESTADSDLRRLEEHLQAADAAARAGDPDATVAGLEHALAGYTGELLPDDGPAEWVVGEREQLHQRLAGACERLADLHTAAGRHAAAARAARAGLDHDRYRDRLWHQLVDALSADGHPAAAGTARAAYRDMLTEIGVPAGTPVTA